MDNNSELKIDDEAAPSTLSLPQNEKETLGPRAQNDDDVLSKALQFLASASAETLGGIAVGLTACTYLVLGRIGLVLIGVITGVVLHASWERQYQPTEDTRRQTGLDVVRRILDSRDLALVAKDDELTKDSGDSFEGFRPETASALNELVEAVLRDYVKWWYGPILPKETSFPAASRQTLTRFLLAVSQHLSRKRHADSFLDFLTNSSSIFIVFLNELASALTQNAGLPPIEAVQSYLLENPESSLANVLSQEQQAKKFKIIAEDILQNFLEKQSYDCGPARTFLREILAGVVLETTLKSCSKPEWINGWIVYLLEEGEPDFNQAIDAGMGVKEDSLSPFNDFDGNVGNISLAKPQKSKQERDNRQEAQRHKKRLSKAEEAMEEAMEEAKRLSQLIAEEDAKKGSQNGILEVGAESPLQKASHASDTAKQTTPRPLDSLGATSSEVEHVPAFAAPLSSSDIPPPLPQRKAVVDGMSLASDSTQTAPSVNSVPSTLQEQESSANSIGEHKPFTSFDQIVPQPVPAAVQAPPARGKTLSLTLLNAIITIYDDSMPNDKGRLRSKPSGDYLVQIEPHSSEHPGWMIVRRYPDFETLHEVLRRIAQISGVAAFTEQHHSLPNWREHTKASLRGELERYLIEALWYPPLAESEGMKRFLEKDQGQTSSGSKSGGGIGWPTPSAFESMGKGMLDVLTSAPKGVAEGGKALGGGITGVFNNISNLGQKKQNSATSTRETAPRPSASITRIDSTTSLSGSRKGRASEDSLYPSNIIQTQPPMVPPMERRPSYQSIMEDEGDRDRRTSMSARSSMSGRRSVNQSREQSRAPSVRGTPISSPTHNVLGDFKLPPPPSDIPDDYGSVLMNASHARSESSATTAWTPTSTVPSQQSPGRPSLANASRENVLLSQPPTRAIRKESPPLSEAETRVAVELLFAVINELYTLSSAWNIRRTLLTAAKTFLLRPGNPSLSSIQSLIQDSVIASNTSDAGIASHLRKLRENTLPTEEELKAWPAEMSPDEKVKLRVKARRLLVERGVPAGLRGVMGNAATAEAMGKLFDSLQVEEVARGLIFGLLLQGVRAVTH